ncbi:hypothetical protein SAMN03159443_05506 [Pseudomonas sp. NFACC15-1]|nr:hypothetical protein SAMN03159443_05506 [Pseudomonas sp. NFACC15-1]SDZ24578.1 hypothetical protein SAMN03159380_05826 [Pseudomonas sp. NFACC14]
MDIYSLRGAGNAGIENAHFSFEYAWQDKDAGPEKAWYGEAGYTFRPALDTGPDLSLQPLLQGLGLDVQRPEPWRLRSERGGSCPDGSSRSAYYLC